MIAEDLLVAYGADYKNYDAHDVIFCEGDFPGYYFQMIKGKLKLNNYNEQGKEFIQEFAYEGESIVSSAIFINKPYPVNAVVMEESVILKLPKSNFLNLLKKNPDFYEKILESLSEDMHYKYVMMPGISFQTPEYKLKTLMNYLKDHSDCPEPHTFRIPFTRQQLADLTGLSVETVIRVIKAMEKNNLLQIQNRKILY